VFVGAAYEIFFIVSNMGNVVVFFEWNEIFLFKVCYNVCIFRLRKSFFKVP
jgi:hypothetical protein